MQRRLSTLERALELVSRDSPVNFAMAARVEGRLTEGRLRSALDRLAPAHPVIASRVAGRDSETRLIVDGVGRFRVRVVDAATDDDWVETTRQELLTPFRREVDPPVRFTLVRGAGWTDLIVCCDHAVSDGLSAALLLREALRLAAQPEARTASAASLPSALPELAPETVRRSLRWRLRLIRAAARAALPIAAWLAGRRSRPIHPPDGFHLMAWSLTEAETKQLVAAARGQNTTVHAAICAAFLIAFAECGNARTRRVSCPVSLRGQVSGSINDTFGLYVSIVETDVNCAPERGFWEIARDLKSGLTKASSETRLWLPVLAAEVLRNLGDAKLKRLARINPKVRYDLSVTNLGRLEFPCPSGAFRLLSLHGPAVNALPDERILGVSTASGRISFTFTFRDHTMDPAKAEMLKESAIKLLSEKAVGARRQAGDFLEPERRPD